MILEYKFMGFKIKFQRIYTHKKSPLNFRGLLEYFLLFYLITALSAFTKSSPLKSLPIMTPLGSIKKLAGIL